MNLNFGYQIEYQTKTDVIKLMNLFQSYLKVKMITVYPD